MREAAALRGIEDFFGRSGCIASPDIRRLPGEHVAEVPVDSELVASASRIAADRVLVIVVRELGPVLRRGIPSLVEGGTEVVLQVRVLDVRAAKPTADVRTHWQNGGMFVIKGVGSLEQDMSAALAAVLR